MVHQTDLTWAELGAGIIAASAHGPIHIGSDSEAFVQAANKLLDQIKNGTDDKIIWKELIYSRKKIWSGDHTFLGSFS